MDKKEQVMENFRELFNKMAWLNKVKMEEALKEYKPSEIHCMEYISRNIDVNVTKLADTFYMTRSAMSKITKKLLEKGYIESYQKPENKKEIYFRLTDEGKRVNSVHEELHNEFRERDKEVFKDITEEQFDNMLKFIDRYSSHLDREIEKIDINSKGE